jgi:hypothetical protein
VARETATDVVAAAEETLLLLRVIVVGGVAVAHPGETGTIGVLVSILSSMYDISVCL